MIVHRGTALLMGCESSYSYSGFVLPHTSAIHFGCWPSWATVGLKVRHAPKRQV
jgi:hypothetical protein